EESGSNADNEALQEAVPITGQHYGSVEPHVFSSLIRAQYWKSLDRRVMVWVWIMFSSMDLIRRNINRAVSDNLLNDPSINTNDYNTGQIIFLVSFLAAELPGGLISKRIGPFRYTLAIIVLFGGLCMIQAGMKSRWSFWLLRALLGITQGGFIPEMTYGSLLAGGFLNMRGICGWAGWQWLFFVMPPSITEPALAFRRPDRSNSWWTEEDEKVLVNRLLRDDPTKGDLNNRTAVTMKGLWEAITDKDLLPLGVFVWIPFQPTANYLSLTLRNLGYTVFESNVLAIPSYIIFAINTVPLGWFSERINERFLISALSNIGMLPYFISLIAIKGDGYPWIRYTLLTGINGLP
ncbi:ophD encodes a permease for phthalate transporter, partial [Penicillium cosmopolitanum]